MSQSRADRIFCFMLAAVLAVTIAFSRANRTDGQLNCVIVNRCDDVTIMDFKNLTIHVGKRVFKFQNGIALNYDTPDASKAPDWKAEIERDTVVQPTPGLFIRFLLIHDSHETGSGWHDYLVGYRCGNGRLQEVFRREGMSLSIDRLDSSRVTVGLNMVPGKPVRKHWSYIWDQDKSGYILSSTW